MPSYATQNLIMGKKKEEAFLLAVEPEPSDSDMLQIGNGDASFESPDVIQAARKREYSKSGCSIQVLPSSLIAKKQTKKSIRK